VFAASMQSVVEDCAVAAKSRDARDKYFQSYVGDYGLCSSSSLRSEVPSLEVMRFECFPQRSLEGECFCDVLVFFVGGQSVRGFRSE